MKKIFSIMLLMFCVVCLKAQNSQTWFDGDAYYTSKLMEGDILFFQGTSADREYDFSFGIKFQNDEYKLVRMTDNDLFPFRADFGDPVGRYMSGNVDVFLIKDGAGNNVWTLKRVSQNHRDALATQLWTKDQPVKKMLSSMVLNPHYFSEFSKTELRFYQEYTAADNCSYEIFSHRQSCAEKFCRIYTDYILCAIKELDAMKEAGVDEIIADKNKKIVCVQKSQIYHLNNYYFYILLLSLQKF